MPNIQLLKAFFQILGCSADYANNGKEAIDLLLKGNYYDLCLMDMQMPVMGGVEATKIIRSDISKDFPIIALTAAALKEDQDNALSAGMTGFLTKPIDLRKLREALSQYAKIKTVEVDRQISSAQSVGLSLDQSILKAGEEIGLTAEEYKEILLEAMDVIAKDIQTLKSAILHKDLAEIKSISHRLKGTCANLRLTEAAQIMKEMDSAAREAKPFDVYQRLNDAFEIVYIKLNKLLH